MKLTNMYFVFLLFILVFFPLTINAKSILNLEQAINHALIANRSLISAEENILSSQFAIQTHESQFAMQVRPAISAGISGGNDDETSESYGLGLEFSKQMKWGSSISVTPRLQRFDSSYDGGVSCNIYQPLFRGVGRDYTLSGLHSAQYSERSARRNLYLNRVGIMLSTVQATYNIIKAEQEVMHNQKSMDRLQLHLAAIKAKSQSGHGDTMDLYRAELEVREAENTLLLSMEKYEDSKDNFKILLALPLEEDIAVSAPLAYDKIIVDQQTLISTALKNREEIAQAEDLLRETKRLSWVAEHNMKPQLDLHLYYSKGGSSDVADSDYGLDEERWGLSLSSSTDIFRRTEKLAYRQSVLRVNDARRNVDVVRDNVIRDVKKEYRNLQKALKQIELQRERVKQAHGKLELAKVKFRWGKADNFSFIESEKQVRQAQTSFTGAIVNYIITTYRFRAALGTLLDKGEG